MNTRTLLIAVLMTAAVLGALAPTVVAVDCGGALDAACNRCTATKTEDGKTTCTQWQYCYAYGRNLGCHGVY